VALDAPACAESLCFGENALVLGIANNETALGIVLGPDERETITQTVTSRLIPK
jgi:hypothetical protein